MGRLSNINAASLDTLRGRQIPIAEYRQKEGCSGNCGSCGKCNNPKSLEAFSKLDFLAIDLAISQIQSGETQSRSCALIMKNEIRLQRTGTAFSDLQQAALRDSNSPVCGVANSVASGELSPSPRPNTSDNSRSDPANPISREEIPMPIHTELPKHTLKLTRYVPPPQSISQIKWSEQSQAIRNSACESTLAAISSSAVIHVPPSLANPKSESPQDTSFPAQTMLDKKSAPATVVPTISVEPRFGVAIQIFEFPHEIPLVLLPLFGSKIRTNHQNDGLIQNIKNPPLRAVLSKSPRNKQPKMKKHEELKPQKCTQKLKTPKISGLQSQSKRDQKKLLIKEKELSAPGSIWSPTGKSISSARRKKSKDLFRLLNLIAGLRRRRPRKYSQRKTF
ncbi:MAG: hypothetical protein HZC29_02760 [Thaumarchaeota archaeon]|nr:hypothetical protein [Nitrososphaerota archaeon]